MIEDIGNSRLKTLDGIRAFAVSAVFVYHAAGWLLPGGFIGVDVFFVLSGFVITRSLLHDGIDFRRFYLRRAFRIIPPVIPVLAYAAFTILLGYSFTTWIDVIGAGASFMNWLRAFDVSSGGMLGHFWSLSVEEQFYLFWPLLLSIFIGSGRLRTLVAASVIALIAVQIIIYLLTGDVERVYNGLDTRVVQLAMGCFVATIRPIDLSRLWLLPVAFFAAALFLMPHNSGFYLTVGIPLTGVMAMLLVAICAWSITPLNWFLDSKPAQWAGSRSYALYLWHYPILLGFSTVAAAFEVMPLIGIISAVIATCIAGELSYFFVEKPARKMRDRIEQMHPVPA